MTTPMAATFMNTGYQSLGTLHMLQQSQVIIVLMNSQLLICHSTGGIAFPRVLPECPLKVIYRNPNRLCLLSISYSTCTLQVLQMRQWTNLELVWGQRAENREPDQTPVWATSISLHSSGCAVTSGGTHHSHGLVSTSSLCSHNVTTQNQASSIDFWDNCSEDFQCCASASGIFCLSGLGKSLTLLELQSSPEGSLWTGTGWVIRGRAGRAQLQWSLSQRWVYWYN